jgi:tRNA pseudouridine55 synthase
MTDGFMNVLKPPGMTSHDVVSFVRRVLHTRKVGHAGTLDPGAAGVLPVAVGRATRLIEYLDSVDKAYRAELKFGIATDSGDDLGTVVERQENFVMPTIPVLQQAARQLTGSIMQVPPAYSAIKIHGEKACDLARRHIAVEIPAREVMIYRLEILSQRTDTLLLDVECSKGTYIRTLCTDFGRLVGIPATMSFLVRLRVGDFCLKDSCTLEELNEKRTAAVLPPERFLSHLPRYDLAPHRIQAFLNGLPTHDTAFSGPSGRVCVYGPDGFLGVGCFQAETASVFPEKIYQLR